MSHLLNLERKEKGKKKTYSIRLSFGLDIWKISWHIAEVILLFAA